MTRIKFLNTEIDNLTFNEALSEIDNIIAQRKPNSLRFDGKLLKPAYLVTPNMDHLAILEENEQFRETYKHADLILADGKPMIWISKLKGTPIKEKVSGSDLFPQICELSAHRGYTIFLLGGMENVLEKAIHKLVQKHLKIKIVGVFSPKFGFENNPVEIKQIIDQVRKASPDILAIFLGAPKQEIFIYKYKDELNVPISLCLGAAIDFAAGTRKRAPHWMQICGLEWLFRLWIEPRRLYKRYLRDFIYLFKLYFKY